MRINKRITAMLVAVAGGVLLSAAIASAQGGYFGAGRQPRPPGLYGNDEEQGMPQGPPVVAMTDDLQFYPSRMVIPVGTTVIWQNVSGTIHTVTDTPGAQAYLADALLPPGAPPFDSGNIAPGQTYAYTFNVPGTYTYYCRHHEVAGMVGQITVVPR